MNAVQQIRLNSNGSSVFYQNGPQEWIPLVWPGNGEGLGASLQLLLTHHNNKSALSFSGEWGLLRLLDSAQKTQLNGNRYRLSWTVPISRTQKRKVSMIMKTTSPIDLFQTLLSHHWQLPERLVEPV